MKHILTLIFFLGSTLSALSQLPHWMITPTNDTLYVIEGTKIIKGEENGKTSLWDMDGKKLYSTEHKINKFNSKLATIQDAGSGAIVGFINTSGRFITLPNVEALYDHPFFENGILVAKKDDRIVMYARDGHQLSTPEFENAYPFSNGFALYFAYGQPDKKKNPYFNYVKPDGSPLQSLIIQDQNKEKVIEPKDIQFLSSLDNSEKGLAIVKNKLYWFMASDYSLIPVQMGEETEKKRHLTLDAKQAPNFSNISEDTLRIYANYGKDKHHVFEFDKMLRLINPNSNQASKNPNTKDASSKAKSKINTYQDKNLYGLIYNGKDSLPCQFEQVGHKYDNNAFAKSKGKWGVIKFDPNAQANIIINDGEAMPFRHEAFDTKVCISLPASFPAEGFNIETEEENGYKIDFSSKECKNTKNGNSIVYACSLNAPNQLPDSLTDITYGPFSLSYDNIRLPKKEIIAKGWYEKHYTIEIEQPKMTVDKGKASFDFTVNANKLPDESDYPYEVEIQSESLPAMCEKISDNNYKCYLDNLAKGSYAFDVIVTEKNCPPCVTSVAVSSTGLKGSATVSIKEQDVKNQTEEIEASENIEDTPSDV